MAARRSAGWVARLLTAAGLAIVSVPLAPILSLGSVAAAAANPSQVNLTLEGCRRPAPAAPCSSSDFTTGDLGKNWSELDNVPHRLTLSNNGAAQDFGIQIAADYEHAINSAHGYDRISSISGPCITSTGSNVIHLGDGVVGGAYGTITNEVLVHLDLNASCVITWTERLAIGSHEFSGSSLQTQILNDDLSSAGQRTVSIPVKDVKPQTISVAASASHVTSYTWDVAKTGSSDVQLDSCAAPPTSPNVSYTVSYTKTADSGGAYTISGTVTLGNPSSRSLTTDSIDVTIIDGARTTHVATGTQHVTVPAATNVSGTLVPGTSSTTFSTTLAAPLGNPVTATASATYQDPDNPGQTIDALASASTSVPLSVTDTPGVGATASISDHETITSGATFKRTDPQAMSAFGTDNTFTTAASDTGSFTIHKIVKATQPENTTATLSNSVALTRSGEATAAKTASADPITITITAAAPKITVTKTVDAAPATNKTFGFTITSNDDSTTSWTTTATVLAGQTSGSSSAVDVAPSASGYTLTETTTPAGYNTPDAVQVKALALCGTAIADVGGSRTLGHVTVVKDLSGPIAGAGTTFDFTVTCPGLDPITLHVDASKGTGTASTDDVIPTGVDCTITESGSPNGWTLTDTTPRDGSATSGTGGDAGTVTFTNTRDLSHITVDKQLSGAIAGAGTSFDFTVSCPGLDPITLHVDASTGSGTASTDDVIPTGVTCTVTETGSPAGWHLTATSPQDGKATSGLGEGADTVTFTNTRDLSHVTVDKVLSGPIAGAGTTFDFTVTCPGLDPITLHVDASNGSGSASTDDVIPTGVTCTITETGSPAGWHLTATSPQDGHATSGLGEGADTVTFTNTRDLGHVTVVKQLVGAAAGAATTFDFTVTCPGLDPMHLQIDAASGSGSASTPDVIPTGVTCTITEASASSWSLTKTVPSDGTATSGSGDSAGFVTFTNSRDLGHVTVVKQLTGPVTATEATFTFTVTCPGLPAMTLAVDPLHGVPSASTGDVIPTGVICTVTELAKDGWIEVAMQPASGTVVAGSGPDSTVTVINAQRTGALAIAKLVDKTSAEADSRLIYTLTVTATGDLTQHDVVVTDTLPGHDPLLNGSWPVTYINGSATCSTGCVASYDPQTHRLTWSLGDVAPPAKVELAFAVTINGPAPVSTAEHVDNAATVSATSVDPVRSNRVRTIVTAVQPFRVTRPPRLAYTGFPAGLVPLGLLLLGAGIVLRRTVRS